MKRFFAMITAAIMMAAVLTSCGGVLNAAGEDWASQFDVQTGELDTLKTFQTMDPETFPEEYRDDLRTLQSQITESLAGDLLFSE